jgi:hypothetical protein
MIAVQVRQQRKALDHNGGLVPHNSLVNLIFYTCNIR